MYELSNYEAVGSDTQTKAIGTLMWLAGGFIGYTKSPNHRILGTIAGLIAGNAIARVAGLR